MRKTRGNRFGTFKQAAKVAERYATKYGRAVVIINFGTHFGIIRNWQGMKGSGGLLIPPRKKNPVGTFSRTQLDRLAHHYGKIKTIAPSGPGYNKLAAYLDGVPQAALKQLAGERIKFLSAMARNRVKR